MLYNAIPNDVTQLQEDLMTWMHQRPGQMLFANESSEEKEKELVRKQGGVRAGGHNCSFKHPNNQQAGQRA